MASIFPVQVHFPALKFIFGFCLIFWTDVVVSSGDNKGSVVATDISLGTSCNVTASVTTDAVSIFDTDTETASDVVLAAESAADSESDETLSDDQNSEASFSVITSDAITASVASEVTAACSALVTSVFESEDGFPGDQSSVRCIFI